MMTAHKLNFNKSLWIIMDPWENQKQLKPRNLLRNIDIDTHNKVVMDKIISYLPNMRYKIVVSDCIKESPQKLQHLKFILHGSRYPVYYLRKFMHKRSLDTIIYCGFHEQDCVIGRELGYNTMIDYYDCYIAKDLVCPYPRPGYEKAIKRQRDSTRYKYIDKLPGVI